MSFPKCFPSVRLTLLFFVAGVALHAQVQSDIPSLYETLAPYFPIGAAVTAEDLAGVHAQLLVKHFNLITSENDMKWEATEPSEGSFSFTKADAEVKFAQAHHMLIRGHNLVWKQQVPAWVFLDAEGKPMTPGAANKTLLTQRLQNHIRGVVTHFGSAVYAWDVVNEPIDPSMRDGFQRNSWYQIIGPEYVDIALQTARQEAPKAKLLINQYNTTQEPMRSALLNLVQGLKARNIPLDAIGHEMHDNIQPIPAEIIVKTINLFAGLGLDNQITELDVSVYTKARQQYTAVPAGLIAQQGYVYRDLFKTFEQLKGKISAVVLWGLADDHTWLDEFPIKRLDLPLLFDNQLQAKPAYWGIVDPAKLPAPTANSER